MPSELSVAWWMGKLCRGVRANVTPVPQRRQASVLPLLLATCGRCIIVEPVAWLQLQLTNDVVVWCVEKMAHVSLVSSSKTSSV